MRRRVYQSDPIALERTQLETYGRIALDEAPITLYTRDNTGAIYSDMVSPLGRRVRCSTKASDYETAKRNALEQWRNWTNESVGSILERYTAQILASPNSTTGESSSVSVIRKNLIPFFKTIRIDELNYKHVFQWQEWRKKPKPHYTQNYQRGQNVLTYDFKPKVPKDSTLKREKVYLVQALGWYSYQTDSLLKEGVLKEIRSAHEFQPKSRNSKKQKQEEAGRFRDVFSEDQRRQLIDHLADFEQKYLGAKKHYEKRLTGFYVRLLLTSGMRPGREIGEIKWSNIYNVPIGDGLGIAIRPCGNGKTGPRDVTCFPDAINIIDGLKALLEEFGFSTDGQSYIFPSRRRQVGEPIGNINGSFRRIIKNLGWDNLVEQPLYACRHTYITHLLTKNIAVKAVAINCGTSIEMIERFYSHVKSRDVMSTIYNNGF